MDDEDEGVPVAWRAAAEQVRAHLCFLRGGGVFLSSTDAWQLVQWLEAGVAVGTILRALERAADARRKNRGRVPLSLVAAKRHLGKPVVGVFGASVSGPGEPVLAPAIRSVPAGPHQAALAEALAAVGRGEVQQALAAVRTFLESVWNTLGTDGQERLRVAARAELGDLVHLVDEGTAEALIEQGARDLLRHAHLPLSAASLSELLDAAL